MILQESVGTQNDRYTDSPQALPPLSANTDFPLSLSSISEYSMSASSSYFLYALLQLSVAFTILYLHLPNLPGTRTDNWFASSSGTILHKGERFF